MRGMADETKPGFRQRIRQLGSAFRSTRQVDPKLVPLMVGIPLAVLLLFVLLGVFVVGPVYGTIVGVLFALMTAMVIFGRRATKAQFAVIEGQPGAAAAVLQSMRGRWFVTPAVAFTRKQDFVHRVVGRPGVVLVGEGSPARVTSLLKQERRKHSRVAGDIPVHELRVGEGKDAVDLAKLQMRLSRLPRAVKPRDIADLDRRMAAVGGTDVPIPKGPMPRMKRR
jgi:hypothetical protein